MELNPQVLQQVQSVIHQARENAVRAVDTQRVRMYWEIGRIIFEEEQKGQQRAAYGQFLIRSLSRELKPAFGSGFSIRHLELCRQFYLVFPIANALRSQFNWTHFRIFIRIENQFKREFYMAETIKNCWTARQLERQVGSQLYERLLLSNNPEEVLAVAKNLKAPENATEIIKDPMVLEFLGLKRESAYYEKDLEQAIITNLQEFMLEMGNGFSFVARQRRILLESDEFFIDLVFYNRLLRCFVIMEIKTHKLTHEDLGQLQMYVNYYDRNEKLPEENPTIGILLCADKNNAVVQYSLPENNNRIYASQYQLYLPTEQQLLTEMRKNWDEKIK